MITNRFLRALLFIPITIATFLIANVAFKDSEFLMFGTLFSALIWFTFILQKELMGYPSNGFLKLIKNILIVVMLAVGFLSIVIGIALYFSDSNGGDFLEAAVVAPALTLGFALYISEEETTPLVKLSYLSVFAFTVVSAILSLLLSLSKVVSIIGVIAFAVGSIVFTVFAFKKDWISFGSVGSSRSSYSGYSYSGSSYSNSSSSSSSSSYSKSSSSSSSSSYSKSSYYSDPIDAMDAIARKCSGSCQLTGMASFSYNVTCSVSGGTAKFTISGNVSFKYGATQSDVNEAKSALQSELNFIANNRIEAYYEDEVSAMIDNGVDCSSVETLSIRTGNITVS